ncbi:hypothetical protein F4809DRAFT_647764 [Biscogniauxia mediterranea]|nr:hypothetical protein F4809DRAFT_647764 [Biscogniauxia mediterranea]
MLSNPSESDLQARQRQHRRQNSTPTAFDTTRIANNLPQHQRQQYQQQQQQRARMSHRRGMSLDTRQHAIRQELNMVSTPTNITGLANTTQHVLRETRQQRLARRGSQHAYANLANDENYLVSPLGTPQMPNFDGRSFDDLPPHPNMHINFDMYNSSMDAMVKKNQESFSGNMTTSPEYDIFSPDALNTPTFMSFHDNPTGATGWISEGEALSSRRSSRRISNGIMDRVSKFETMNGEEPQRPLTPPRQDTSGYFPLTPVDTPHDRTIKHGKRPQRFTEGYDESSEETVKPTKPSASRRPRTTFDEMRQAAEAQAMMPTPHRANTMPATGAYDPPVSATSSDFINVGNVHEGLRIDTTFDGLPGPSHPMSAASDFSHHPSPTTSSLAEFRGHFDYESEHSLSSVAPESITGDEAPSTEREEKSSRRFSPHHHRRNESTASIASAASIASIDIEKTKTTTGITLDDIQQYIQGPDPRDNKWVCTFEGCNKKFGRKENIKSHVQTHLNDRQYKCPTCQKCFVRQHDLKRHAKIHTGIKPYPCECGNSFARHDALTRHKQRGMCIGAFDGVVRKLVKRGRPRKHRPDMDERKEKSTRTRKKNKSTSSTSSQSGYSDSSAVNSPENMDNEFDMLDDIMDVSLGGTTMNPSSLHGLGSSSSSAPMPSLTTADPSLGAAPSPSAGSVHSYVSQLSHMSLHPEAMASSHPTSPAKSIASHYAEPPELSQSSSPPPSSRYFDVETTAAPVHMGSLSGLGDHHHHQGPDGSVGANDDDILLQFTNSESSMLMLGSDGKFVDETFSDVSMFATSDDFIFDSTG